MKKQKKRSTTESKILMRLNFINIVVILLFATLSLSLYRIQLLNSDYYAEALEKKNEVIIESNSAPRGNIYDRNYKLIVGNIPVPSIMYKREVGTTIVDEIDMAYTVSDIIDMPTNLVTTRDLKDFWLIKYPEKGEDLITPEEYDLYWDRELSDNDIYQLKLERITDNDLDVFSYRDVEALAVFAEMRRGSSYDTMIVKNENVTEEEYSVLSENLSELPGFMTEIDWERHYPYGNCFKSILGKVSTTRQGLPADKLNEFLAKGYRRNDRVGVSGLEYQYEDLLKGEKKQYRLTSNGTYELIYEGQRGHDIVLTIDIEFQCNVEKIIEQEIKSAKKDRNTEYFKSSYVVVTEPNTGGIFALAGKMLEGKDVYDLNVGTLTSSVTAGSVVKGASQLLAYDQGVINVGSYRRDVCLEIAATQKKCSWRTMGNINDLYALQWSSNVYQFLNAIDIAGGTYRKHKPIDLDPEAFDIYRNYFSEFGLGVKTGIDFPVEGLGYRGSETNPGFLLDLSIGQYDSYTPIQVAQYISTIANGGYRLQPTLLKEVYYPLSEGHLEELKYKTAPNVLNAVDTTDRFMSRVQAGFRLVVTNGTGKGFMGNAPKGAGKTGTSESFADPDGDGWYTTPTISKNFVGFAPYDNPKMAITVMSPDVSSLKRGTYYSSVNQKITERVSNLFFQIYK